MSRWLCMTMLLLALSPLRAETIAIIGGIIETASPAGRIENGTVLIRDGRIVAVGRDIAVPSEATRVNAQGRIVTPGLVDPVSTIGLAEVSLEPSSVDTSVANDRFGAALDAADAFNPRSMLVPVNRIEGVTRAVVTPAAVAGSVIAGRSAAVNFIDTEQPVDRRHVAVVAGLGEGGAAQAGGARTAALAQLREALAEARDYGRNKRAWEQGARRNYRLGVFDLEALQPVLRGELPLAVKAERASDIVALLELAAEHEVRLVVVGGAEAWLVADRLAAAGVPVILNPFANLPQRFETLGATLENAARLEAAGVEFAFSSPMGGSHNARNLGQGAGVAVANGLPWRTGLEAITANPARIWGLERVGQLQPGFDADVVIWDGDPLEVTSFPDAVYIKGRAVPMVSRQTLLRDRYLKLLSLGETKP
ncbi:MAG TPA: amidohydrolase family protein [Gammaproteobacteria bacterium]|nr:amidohydrolase family protein [Gammaproteobacteria bacterium]